MAQTMVVGIDGSEGSRRAATCALERAESAGAKLFLVYVIDWSPYTFNTAEENEQRHKRREEEIDKARSAVIDPLLRDLRSSAKTEVEGVIRHGKSSRVLIDVAREVDASQIFVGRLGESDPPSILFGSVASHLMQASPVPVTVVP